MNIYGENLIDVAPRGDNLHSNVGHLPLLGAALHTETDITL